MFDYQRRAKPVLKWAGGKSSSLPVLVEHFPEKFERYIEPFLGGGSVFLTLKEGVPSVVSDANTDLIFVYDSVKCAPHKLMARLDKLAAEYSEEFFFRLREAEPSSALDRAARLIFLNKTCFNGLYRTNSKGKFNVPFGKRPRCPNLYDRENLLVVSDRLKLTKIFVDDFEAVIDQAGAGDFVYCDPPYLPLSLTAYFNSYTAGGFSWEDHKRLKAACERAVKRGAYVIVSNSATDTTHSLYRNWRLLTIQAPRSINSKGDKRGRVPEILAIRTPASAARKTSSKRQAAAGI